MTLLEMRSVLLTAIRAAIGTNVPTELENAAFTPTPETLWISVSFLPVDDTAATLGAGGENEVTYICQVTVNVPTNTGEATLQGTLNTLRDYFTPGKLLTYSTHSVRLTKFDISPPRQADVWYRRSASIYYYARLPRP